MKQINGQYENGKVVMLGRRYLKLKDAWVKIVGSGCSVVIEINKEKTFAQISYSDTSLFPIQEKIFELTKEEFMEVFNEASEIIRNKI